MKLTVPQMSRLAVLMDQADITAIRVDGTDTHELDGTVVARLAGEVHIIDPVGREVPAERYVRDTYGLAAVVA